jgi:regulator of cell morphogenesis and NO signaling
MAAASQTVRQIAIDQPSAIEVFDRMGIEYCCRGWKTLKDACSEIATSMEDVMRALDQAAAGDKARGPRFENKTFEFLILRALRNQHERVKEELPLLQGTAATVADRYRTRYPELPAIDELIQALSLKLTAHLAEEEDTLFPALLQLELAYLGESPIAGYPKRVRKILTSMSLQHDTSGLMLHQIWAESQFEPSRRCRFAVSRILWRSAEILWRTPPRFPYGEQHPFSSSRPDGGGNIPRLQVQRC